MMHASLYGRLGKDAQPIETKTGKAMTAVSVAVDVSSRDGEATIWVRVIAFGAAAELLAKHAKGDALSATGRLELSRWKGDDGTEREAGQMIADHFVSARTARPRGGAGGDFQAPSGRGKPKSKNPDGPPPFDDAIPF